MSEVENYKVSRILQLEESLINQKKKLNEIRLTIKKLEKKTRLIISRIEKSQGDVLYQEGNFDGAVRCYENAMQFAPRNQSIHLALCNIELEKSNFKQASVYFNQASLLQCSQKQPEETKCITLEDCQQKVYDLLWKSLNCTDNNPRLNDIKHNLDIGNLQQNNIEKYFEKLSSYKIVSLHNLAKQEAELLKNSKISIEYLQLTQRGYFEFQLESTNKFSSDSDRSKCLSISYPSDIKDEIVFQNSIAENGYMYAYCPFTGQILSSNQSLIARYWTHFYRFVSRDVFYILVNEAWSGKRAIYFPKLEVIVLINQGCQESKTTLVNQVNQLKSFLVKNWKQAINYITHKESKKTVAFTAFNPNMGHYLWNELSGIERLYNSRSINKIDKIIVGRLQYFVPFQEIFSEIDPNQIIEYREEHVWNLGKFILENNYFAFKPGDRFIPESLVERIRRTSVQKCSQSFLQEIEESKQHFPLIWINIRAGHSGHREWVGEIDGIANIIRKLTSDYPNGAVVFDGASRIETISFARDEKMIQVASSKTKQILDLLTENHIKIYNTIGSIMYESIVWASTVDFYVIPAGSGVCKASWITGKPCIIHGPHEIMQLSQSGSSVLESRPSIRRVPNEFITKAPTDHKGPYGYDWYNCDWKGIYQEIVQLTEEIKYKKNT
jgi:hypothetical protein